MSAPPLANGQAVFGAASQALLGGGLLDGSMLQQGTVPAMTPEMAAALQVRCYGVNFRCAADAVIAGCRAFPI